MDCIIACWGISMAGIYLFRIAMRGLPHTIECQFALLPKKPAQSVCPEHVRTN